MRTIGALATCVEPSLNVIGNVFIEIIGLDVVNEGVSVHITQLKILAMGTSIHWLHVVVMVFVHNDLTKIEDCLPEIDGFVHHDLDLPHFAPHQVFTKSYSRLEVRLHHPLELGLLIHHEIDVLMLPDVLNHLPKNWVVH